MYLLHVVTHRTGAHAFGEGTDDRHSRVQLKQHSDGVGAHATRRRQQRPGSFEQPDHRFCRILVLRPALISETSPKTAATTFADGATVTNAAAGADVVPQTRHPILGGLLRPHLPAKAKSGTYGKGQEERGNNATIDISCMFMVVPTKCRCKCNVLYRSKCSCSVSGGHHTSSTIVHSQH